MRQTMFGNKRAIYVDVTHYARRARYALGGREAALLEKLDVVYRTLVALLYNYVPTSGHPGGSISCGRIAEHLLLKEMAYDLRHPLTDEADIISYAAGHKALGLYALWALRNECARIAAPALLPAKREQQLRLEDLLGFRRNAAQDTPLFKKLGVKPLGGHPEPIVPFVRTSTGASGVGDGSAVGLALAAADAYGEKCPFVHVIEGEGGLTAGRVSEAVSVAATAQLKNLVFHLDWNGASIESDRVTSDGSHPGDYVQWNPCEFFRTHDCNVLYVPNGHNFFQIHIAQQLATDLPNHQPTAIVYRTVKGWKYGIEGKKSHGAGHKFASQGFYESLAEFEKIFKVSFPRFEGEQTPITVERYFWDSLLVIRQALEKEKQTAKFVANLLTARQRALRKAKRNLRKGLGNSQSLYTRFSPEKVPAEFAFKPGTAYTTRGVLGEVLGYLNKKTNGTLLVGSADLYGSTGAAAVAKDFPAGNFNAVTNPDSRRIAMGGICEDGMAAVCSGISSFGKHVAVSASYGAFVAFEHVAARLHAIGVQAARQIGLNPNTLVLFNGHASLPTGEDGPTHADPQSLQLLQDNFPAGMCITATPLEVDEIWPLVVHSFAQRPAVFAPFVIRPGAVFMDRKALGIEPAANAVNGLYYLHRAKGQADGTVFVQGAGVGRIVVEQVLPVLGKYHLNINVVYITSRELFEALPEEKQEKLLPLALRQTAMGITDFTRPTMDAWLLSQAGRSHTLYPHRGGAFLGSARADKLYAEAGMSGADILAEVRAYVNHLKQKKSHWQ